MSGSIAGSRALDDRRRRRLAVAGDGASEQGDAGALAVLRERQLDLPAASPWLPRQRWKFWLTASAFWLGLIVAAVLIIQPVPPHPQVAPAIHHLVDGTRPVLGTYADILLWTLAAQMASLVGWYRSHSQLDFSGRYRLWSWAVLVFGAWGFCAGTEIHTAIGMAAGPQLRWPIWRAEIVVWLTPAMAAGLSVWWVIRNDLKRCRVSHTLIHLAISTLLLTGVGLLYQVELSSFVWGHGALVAGQYLGMGLLVTGLWWHAWHVTYVCADPPEATEPVDWRAGVFAIASMLLSWLLWPFRRRTSTAAKPSKRKGDDETAPKRRRKTTAKSKRTTRSRTRVKADDEEATDDEDDASDEDEADSGEDWSEDEEEESRPHPKSTQTIARSPAPMQSRPSIPTPVKSSPPQAPAKSSWSDADDEEDDSDDDDDTQYRVDGAHGGADPFKGLSKRQRRELKRQMRDQQRQQESRGR